MKNWSPTKKILAAIGIVLVIAAIYNWKAIAGRLGLLNERKSSSDSRQLPACKCPDGTLSPLCCGNSAREYSASSSQIPIEVVPSSCGG